MRKTTVGYLRFWGHIHIKKGSFKVRMLQKPSQKVFFLSCFLAACLLRLGLAWMADGYLHPDAHFQVLEPAWGFLGHDWFRAWEWERGVRSWSVPMFFAHVFTFCQTVLGWKEPILLAKGARMATVLWGMVGVWGFWAFVQKMFSGKKASFVFVMAVFSSPWIFYSTQTLSSTLALPFVIWSHVFFLKGMRKEHEKKSFFYAGILLGLSFFVRFQCGLFGLGLGMWLLWKKKFGSFSYFSFGALLIIGAQGMLDLWTWGSFLHAPIEYFRFNILEHGASRFGKSSWYRYLVSLNHYFYLPGALIFLLGLVWSFRKEVFKKWLPLYLSAGGFLLVHQIIAHKENRFLIPVLPFLFCFAFLGWEKKLIYKRKTTWIVLLIFLASSSVRLVKAHWFQYRDCIQSQLQVRHFLETQYEGKKNILYALMPKGSPLIPSGFYLKKSVQGHAISRIYSPAPLLGWVWLGTCSVAIDRKQRFYQKAFLMLSKSCQIRNRALGVFYCKKKKSIFHLKK